MEERKFVVEAMGLTLDKNNSLNRVIARPGVRKAYSLSSDDKVYAKGSDKASKPLAKL